MSSLYINGSNAVLTLVLCRITLLLAAGWLLHAALRNRNPWLSIWAWRAIIAGVVVVAITGSHVPGWGLEVGPGFRDSSDLSTGAMSLGKTGKVNSDLHKSDVDKTQAESNAVDVAASHVTTIAIGNPQSSKLGNWIQSLTIETTLCSGYLIVVGFLMLRLFLQVLGVQSSLRMAQPADDHIETLVRTTAQSLGLAKAPCVLVSSLACGPLATGILRPTIVLPIEMTEQFSDRDLRFMIAHECAHFAGRDLAWALAARVMRILLWPHPLTWGIPSAHRFACDVRCDGVAAGRDATGYSKMLAGLAISWHARSVPSLAMAFIGQSETIRRVELLDSGIGRDRPSRFRQIRAVLGMAIGFCLVGTVGINRSDKGVVLGQADTEQVQRLLVTVVDKQGKPVEGAEVDAPNLRTRKNPDAHHGNPPNKKTKTNQQGTAEMLYPKYVYEQMETGQVTLTVSHPDFVAYYQDHRVDSPIKVTLEPGRRVRLTAKDASTGQRIRDRLFVLTADFAETMPWKLLDGNVHLSHPLSNEIRLMLVVCLQDGKPTLFSDLIDLGKYPPGDCRIDDVTMSPGRKIAGRLSDDVPRPVIKGRVGLVIASSVSDSPVCGNSIIWEDFVSTNEDGTFEFSSVPRNEIFQLAAYCRGWVSVTPSVEQIRHFPGNTSDEGAQIEHDTLVVAQHFAADNFDPVEIKMEPLASCRVTVKDGNGTPIPDVSVSLSSYTSWSPDFTCGIGYYSKTSVTLGLKKDEAYRQLDKSRDVDKDESRSNITDSNGQATIHNLAGKKDTWVGAFHEDFELPPGKRSPYHRSASVDLKPGEMSEITLTLQRKGVEIIGK